jgi:hypothetical protein
MLNCEKQNIVNGFGKKLFYVALKLYINNHGKLEP